MLNFGVFLKAVQFLNSYRLKTNSTCTSGTFEAKSVIVGKSSFWTEVSQALLIEFRKSLQSLK